MSLPGAIELPDGSRVRGRGLRNPTPEGTPEYALYLGSPKMRRAVMARPDAPSWAHEWVEWPDFRLPRSPEQAVALIRDLHARAVAGERVEVACGGGVGRTGTVIACLAVLAGVPSGEAVTWTRANYNRRAVETPWQKRWVGRFPDVTSRR
ncbi:protein-tyrosine phosphatase family protein [Saccharothrix sp. HUAS TT1]|uniref:protein-tyrosine phosphatase family protein n=1 Tax=unclassified Saccharothrix TaxID=2593673 RepID=UPI00345BE8D6